MSVIGFPVVSFPDAKRISGKTIGIINNQYSLNLSSGPDKCNNKPVVVHLFTPPQRHMLFPGFLDYTGNNGTGTSSTHAKLPEIQ